MTGVILSGGKCKRMGVNKAFLEINGERLIDRTVELFRELFDEVILVTNEPLPYLDLNATIVGDIIKGAGALGGVYSGLYYASCSHAFVAACDMPFLNRSFIVHMLSSIAHYDVVVPKSDGCLEPLHAVYSKSCLPAIKDQLMRGNLKIIDLYKALNISVISEQEIRKFDLPGRMFLNVNTKEDLGSIISQTGFCVRGNATWEADENGGDQDDFRRRSNGQSQRNI